MERQSLLTNVIRQRMWSLGENPPFTTLPFDTHHQTSFPLERYQLYHEFLNHEPSCCETRVLRAVSQATFLWLSLNQRQKFFPNKNDSLDIDRFLKHPCVSSWTSIGILVFCFLYPASQSFDRSITRISPLPLTKCFFHTPLMSQKHRPECALNSRPDLPCSVVVVWPRKMPTAEPSRHDAPGMLSRDTAFRLHTRLDADRVGPYCSCSQTPLSLPISF